VPAVLSCSALENVGLDELWAAVVDHRERLTASGALAEKRGQQQVRWLWNQVEDGLRETFRAHPAVARDLLEVERAVRSGKLIPAVAARRLLAAFAPGSFPAGNASRD
ncbi:MAG: methylmalonyl Co-A mutase-associated GTPase MeaB, partial [Planctomycetota bacterium]